MVTHFVYAGYNYYLDLSTLDGSSGELICPIREKMKEYKIKKVMVTSIFMQREQLITKEEMESYCTGKKSVKLSVNDDLECLFEDIQLGNEPDNKVWTYFLPKLTEDELNLVNRKDKHFMNTFLTGLLADVPKVEMKASESSSKFVLGQGIRRTWTVL